ncbi:unnamed protein product, partial [Symbiodinium sp. CCMP2592]
TTETTGEAAPKGKGKAEATKGSGKGKATGEATPKGKGKGKSQAKGAGKDEATGEATPKGKGKGKSQTKGAGKDEATGEATPKGKGKAKSQTKGSGNNEATGEAAPKGKGKAEATKGSRKDEATGEATPKGKGKAKSQTKGSGKDEATGEATPKGKGKAKSQTKGSGNTEATGEAAPKGKGKAEATKGSRKDEATGEATPKGKGKAKSQTKGSGKDEATGEATPKGKGKGKMQTKASGTTETTGEAAPKGKGKAEATKGSGKGEATGEATPKGKGKGKSQAKGAGKDEATGEATPKGKGKAEATKGSGKDETTGEATPKGKGEGKSQAKGSGKGEATGEATPKGKGKGKSQAKGSGKDEATGEATPATKGKGKAKSPSKGAAKVASDAEKAWCKDALVAAPFASCYVQKLSLEKIEAILAMTEPGELDLPTRFAFLKAFVQHKDMPDIEDPKNPEMRIYTVFRDIKDSSAKTKEVGTKTSGRAKLPANKAARAAFAETMQNKADSFAGSWNSVGEELTLEEKEKKDFQRDLQQLRQLGDKALTAATNLKSTGLKRQEADVQHMGDVNTQCYGILRECNTLLFSSEPLSKAREYLDSKAHQLQEYAKDVAHAEGVFQTFERRKASEKRKREKEELKKQATADLDTQVDDAEQQEEWPDENENNEDNGEDDWEDDDAEVACFNYQKCWRLDAKKNHWGHVNILEAWSLKQPWRKILPEPHKIWVPYVNLDAAGNEDRGWYEHSMFLPHEVMGCIYNFDRDFFHKRFENTARNRENLLHTGGSITRLSLKLVISLCLCDYMAMELKATEAGTQNFEIFLLQSVLGEETSCMDTRTSEARELIMKAIAWSLEVLGQGVYPSVDMNGECLKGSRREQAGRRICGKYTVVLDAFQMALQWILKYPQPGDPEPNNPELLFTNFGRRALHRQRLCSGNDEFIAVHGWSPFAGLAGGYCPWRILPDYMHIVHLACLGDALTSMLLDLSDTQWPWPGSSRDARLEIAWQSYKEYCQYWNIADRCERKLFTNETLRHDYVTVSQKFMRAAAAKFMVFWMHWFMNSLLQGDEQPEHLKLILGVVTGLMYMEQLQMENGRFFREDVCQNFEAAYYLYRSSFDRLASRAVMLQVPRWKCRPKQHMLEHAVLDFVMVLRQNPRFSANYLGEDAVRRVKQLAIASHPNFVSRHVLFKWALQFSLRFRGP